MKYLTLFVVIFLIFFGVVESGNHIQTDPTVAITEISGIVFPSVVPKATSQTIILNPSDSGAAFFQATGNALAGVILEVIPKDIILRAQGSTKITVEQFSFGGSITPTGDGLGYGTFDSTGNLTNIRIGAQAIIPANPKFGAYTGDASLRIIHE